MGMSVCVIGTDCLIYDLNAMEQLGFQFFGFNLNAIVVGVIRLVDSFDCECFSCYYDAPRIWNQERG